MAIYNPSNFTASNKSYAVQGIPDSARYFYTGDDFISRPFLGVAEALAYFNTPLKRRGKFTILVNEGGSYVNGDIVGGVYKEYWWRDGVNDDQLVVKTASGSSVEVVSVKDERFGAKGDYDLVTHLGTDDTAAFEAAIAYVSNPVIKLPFGAQNPDTGKANYFDFIAPRVKSYILIPDGRYKITRPIALNPYVRFVGNSSENYITNGNQGSTLVASGISGYMFYTANVRFSDGVIVPDAFVTAADIDNGGYSYCPNPEFERLTFIVDTSKPEVPISFMKLSGATSARIRHCTMIGSKLGPIVNTSWNWTIESNMVVPLVGGFVFTESITTGVFRMNEVNGSLMPAGGIHSDTSLPFGLSASAGHWDSGKCFGTYLSHCNIQFEMNVMEFGMFYGIISKSSGGVIDNTYMEGIAAGGAAYAQELSAYMRYNVGETSLAPSVRLVDFQDFSRSEIYFYSNVCNYSIFGNVDPGSSISLYQFRNPGVTLPKGVNMMDNWASDINDDLKNILSIPMSKTFTMKADCPLTGNVNLNGDRFILGNGNYPTVRKVAATGRIFAFAKDILFRDISIDVNTNGFITPVSGEYVIRFEDCVIDLTNGPLLTNDQAFVNQINKVTLVFSGHTIVKSDSQVDLIGNLDPQWARLDVTIIKSDASEFINVNIPNDSIPLKIVEIYGFIGYPSVAARASSVYAGGKMLFKDPTFKTGANGIIAYNNLNNGNVTVTRVTSDTVSDPAPTDSGYILKITNSGASSPDNGGFAFGNMTRPNAVFVVRMIAKLPKGAIIDLGTNQYGNDGYTEENRPRVGTGKWEEYLFTVRCGATGTFDKTNLFSTRNGTANTSWYLAYATVFDMTVDAQPNEFTDAEKAKLAGIQDHFKGTYSTLTGLQSAHATGVAGDYAVVDTAADAPVTYIWDNNGSAWVIGSPTSNAVASVNGQTGAVSITKESLGVTNDFTTTEKTKLSGISPGATANSSDTTLKDRANHTGTQAMTTVSGLTAALAAKVDALPGQGLSETSYTAVEKTKLGTYPSDGSTLMPKAGGSFTGKITFASAFAAAAGGAINLNNGDIIGANALFFADETDTDAEGFRFQKAAGTADVTNSALWDTLRAYRGELLWSGLLGLTLLGDAKAPNLLNVTQEVDVTGTLGTGKISEQNGAYAADSLTQITGFIPVVPGQKLRVSFATGDFNVSPPVYSTGVIGYSSAPTDTTLYSAAYVATILSQGTWNASKNLSLSNPIKFVDQDITIPAGVNFIKVSNLISAGVTLKVITLKPTGTLKGSIDQLFQRIYDTITYTKNQTTTASSNLFTQADQDKLDSIVTPTVSWDNGGIIFTAQDTGLKYRGILTGTPPALSWVALATSLRSFTQYPVGYAIDYDKMTATDYTAAISDAGILTPENGFLPGHLQPGLVSGATKYIPKVSNGGVSTLRYDFVEADNICNYAINKGVKIHANHLTWHTGVNAHVNAIVTDNPGNEKAMLTAYLKEYIPVHIQHFETNFPGLVISWNVTNEAIYASHTGGPAGGTAKDSIWATWFTLDEFWEITYTAACSASTTCKFFSNDFDLETSNTTQADSYLLRASNLLAKNIVCPNGRVAKMDGIGFQFHTVVGQDFNVSRIYMKRFADLGYLVAITELDVTITGTTYTDAMATQQAQAYYDIFIAYERAVPANLRWGVMMWSVTDKFYIKNNGKNAPGSATNAATIFASLYDWYGAKKPAYFKVLTIPGRPAFSADIFQDFIVTGTLAKIAGTLTSGSTPATWFQEGYTGSDVGVGPSGLRAPQNSQNSYQYVGVDYTTPNRVVQAKLSGITGPGNRVTYLLLRYQDSNNFTAIQASNDATTPVWQFIKKSGGSFAAPVVTTVTPKIGDDIRVLCDGVNYTVFINDIQVLTTTEATLNTATKAGFALRGYNDKFTIWENFSVDGLPAS